ncbi:DEAD/DEAH box helicase family protein [Chromatium okenii]|uniref:DEAD/DEAH box helicase family protein n=1 Tax=Chromatium okenii TaxID=61644 RepID=UPI000CF4AE9C|nr:DEAD/DEAH box helicase family protein [Chromatium okenii]
MSTITDSATIKSDLAQAMEKASAFADEINAAPDTLPAPSAQRELVLPAAIKDCLVLIEKAENPVQVARKVLLRQVPRLPLEITSPELIDAVCGAIPECTDETKLALSDALDEAITTAMRRAREDNQLNANLTLDSIQEVIPAMRTLWAQGHRCFLIRAPMGSGKTQLVLKTIFDQINNVVALTYSTSLVDNLVSRFEGATHYQDMAVDECALVEKIVACINSIGKINIRKSLDAAKAILTDEIAHVVRVLYDPDGTLKSTAGAITRQFFDAIKATVKHGIFAGVDANLNDLTVAAFRHNGAKPYVIDVVDHNPPKPMKIHRSEKRIWWSASNEVNDGGRVFIACSGAKESLRVDRHLRAQCPGKKGLVINSRGGYATSGDPNQRAWFKDVNGLVVQYDWIIFSPAVESGVSIEVKHFTKWFGIYDGTKCASDFHQMLARDRTATGYEVAITGTLKKPAPRTAKEELADALYCAHLDHGSIIEASSYDVVAAVFEVVRKRRVQYYGRNSLPESGFI